MKPITEECLNRAREDLDLGLLPSGKPTIQDAKELFDFAEAIYRNVKRILELNV